MFNNMIPIDCWSKITSFISDYNDYINLLLLNKDIYNYVLKYIHKFNNLEINIKDTTVNKSVSIYDIERNDKVINSTFIPKIIKTIYGYCNEQIYSINYSILKKHSHIKTYKIYTKLFNGKSIFIKFKLSYFKKNKIVKISKLVNINKDKKMDIEIKDILTPPGDEGIILIYAKYVNIAIRNVTSDIESMDIILKTRDINLVKKRLYDEWKKSHKMNYYKFVFKNRNKSMINKQLNLSGVRKLFYTISCKDLKLLARSVEKDICNCIDRDAYEHDMKFGEKEYYHSMIDITDLTFDEFNKYSRYVNFYMYYPKYYVIKPNNYLDPKKISFNSEKFKYNLIDLIGIRLYDTLKEINKYRKIKLFLVGSSVPLLVNGCIKGASDIDIFVKNMYNVIDTIIELFIIFEKNGRYKIIKMERKSKLRLLVEIKCNKNNIIKLDLFGSFSKDYLVLNTFHLPIVIGWYDFSNGHLYGFMSFIRAIKYNCIYNLNMTGYLSSNYKLMIEIFYKYFNKGFGCIFNDLDKDKFISYLKNKGINDYVVECKINSHDIIKELMGKNLIKKHIGAITTII